MLTGVGFQWWILPLGLTAWLILWFGSFSVIEDGIGLLGMITLSFVVSAWRFVPDPRPIAHGFIPALPHHDLTRYAFLAVSIVGATVSPYLLNFYSLRRDRGEVAGAELWINRMTAFLGMGFGSTVSHGRAGDGGDRPRAAPHQASTRTNRRR